MKKTENRVTQKRHHVQAATTARRDRRPKSLVPFVAALASNALCHHPIHHRRPNVLLREIVRRCQRGVLKKMKITFAVFLETFRQRRRLLVLRNETHDGLLNRVYMPVHQAFEADFGQFVLPMNRREHFLDVFQQPLSVVRRRPARSCSARRALIFQHFEKFDVAIALAVLAPVHQLLIFGNDKRLGDEFDLLNIFRFDFGQIKRVAAVGAGVKLELDDGVDEFGREGRSEILFTTGLGSFFFVSRFFRVDFWAPAWAVGRYRRTAAWKSLWSFS